jgi:hypothetical protein
MNRLALLVAVFPLYAHVISMSSGDLVIDGRHARYVLRMPAYEMAHVKAPDRLFDHVRFSTGGRAAQLLSKSCRQDADAQVCTAEYEFPVPVDTLEVECTFHSITVANHVHLLRAEMDGRRDQAMLDFSFPGATLRFRPPSAFETAVTQTGAGVARALGGPVQLLFLAGLALAARSRREMLAIAGSFIVGQTLAAVVLPYTGWRPPARFVEAASALTIAYLAVEILLLPRAGSRWLVAGMLGAFHGLYFELFLRTTDYAAFYVLAGATMAEVLVLSLLLFIFSKIGRIAARLRPVQVSATALLAFGMVWFFLRLKG